LIDREWNPTYTENNCDLQGGLTRPLDFDYRRVSGERAGKSARKALMLAFFILMAYLLPGQLPDFLDNPLQKTVECILRFAK